ncbi:MAG: peptidoglycan recognition family protein [Elusimicrobiota bacterium]
MSAVLLIAGPACAGGSDVALITAALHLRQRTYNADQVVEDIDKQVLQDLYTAQSAQGVLTDIHVALSGISPDSTRYFGGLGPELFAARQKIEGGVGALAGAPGDCKTGSLAQWQLAVDGRRRIQDAVALAARARTRVRRLQELEERLASQVSEQRRRGDSQFVRLERLRQDYKRAIERIAAHLDSGLGAAALRAINVAGKPDCAEAKELYRMSTTAGIGAGRGGAQNGESAAAGTVPVSAGGGVSSALLPRAPTESSWVDNRVTGAVSTGKTLSALEAYEKNTYGSSYPILSREDWGARTMKRAPKKHNPNRMTVHHTVGHQAISRADAVRSIKGAQNFHMDTRGWNDIGYHFLVDGAGRVFEGVPVDVVGTHVGNNNTGNIGMSLMGNFEVQKPTTDQLGSLERLASFLTVRYHIDAANKLLPHRHYNATACPGRNVVAVLSWFRMQVARRAGVLSGQLLAQSGADEGFIPLVVVQPRT